jgi:hypothetical protein
MVECGSRRGQGRAVIGSPPRVLGHSCGPGADRRRSAGAAGRRVAWEGRCVGAEGYGRHPAPWSLCSPPRTALPSGELTNRGLGVGHLVIGECVS